MKKIDKKSKKLSDAEKEQKSMRKKFKKSLLSLLQEYQYLCI